MALMILCGWSSPSTLMWGLCGGAESSLLGRRSSSYSPLGGSLVHVIPRGRYGAAILFVLASVWSPRVLSHGRGPNCLTFLLRRPDPRLPRDISNGPTTFRHLAWQHCFLGGDLALGYCRRY